nr:hypothetical protein [bacterium]
MKAFSIGGTVLACIVGVWLCVAAVPAAANFTFSFPELMLIEDINITVTQTSVDVGFDNADRLHAAWSEDMGSGI